MIVRTLDRLAAHPRVAGLMVALVKDDPHWPGIEELEGKPVRTCIGGEERALSVLAALDALGRHGGRFRLGHWYTTPRVRASAMATSTR
jgi:2-C-methyl-D-erythritol 4-phosphate cytidylyltransferase